MKIKILIAHIIISVGITYFGDLKLVSAGGLLLAVIAIVSCGTFILKYELKKTS